MQLVRCEDHVHIGEVAQTVAALVGGLPTAATHEAARCRDLLHFRRGVGILKHALLIGGADTNSRAFRDLLGQSEIFHQELGLNICFFHTNHILFYLFSALSCSMMSLIMFRLNSAESLETISLPFSSLVHI